MHIVHYFHVPVRRPILKTDCTYLFNLSAVAYSIYFDDMSSDRRDWRIQTIILNTDPSTLNNFQKLETRIGEGVHYVIVRLYDHYQNYCFAHVGKISKIPTHSNISHQMYFAYFVQNDWRSRKCCVLVADLYAYEFFNNMVKIKL